MKLFTSLSCIFLLTFGIFYFSAPEVFAACPPDCSASDPGARAGGGDPDARAGGGEPDARAGGGDPDRAADTPRKAGTPITIANPLGEGSTLAGFASDIISVLLVFITPIIVLAYIFAGFKYVISRGNPEEIKKATTWLLYISIGAVLSLGAFTILKVLENTINAFKV